MPGSLTFKPVHPIYRRLAILTEGALDIYRNKTAMGLLRFRPEDVVCVIDSKYAGADLCQLCGIDAKIPVVGDIHAAIRLGVEWLVIGVNTPGGFLPNSLRPQVYEAIRNRVGVISGLHESVNGDPNLVALSARYAVELVNLRATPDDRLVSTGKARETKAHRLLVVGTDANIGKTTVALGLERYMNREKSLKINARFVSTSQDSILITGRGVAIDRMISDFAGGMVEQLVLHEDQHDADILVVEGQNSICSPCYSGTALSVLHGSCPDSMILCHNPTRTMLRHTDAPMPSIQTYIMLYEEILAPIHPGKIVAIVLSTQEMTAEEGAEACRKIAQETGLPVVDPVRDGDAANQVLATAVLAAKARQTKRLTPADIRKADRPAKAQKATADKTEQVKAAKVKSALKKQVVAKASAAPARTVVSESVAEVVTARALRVKAGR